jgi:hypothetical protein
MPDRGRSLQLGLAALFLSAGPVPAVAQMANAPQQGDCEQPAFTGGGALGCYLIATSNLGPMPRILYWHIDVFPDVGSAEAARTLYGTVTVALGGQVFLQTVNDNPGWTAPGGRRIAMVGPLPVRTDADLTARFMELTAPAPTFPRAAAGPQAIFLVEGSACIRTPSAATLVERDRSFISPTGIPSIVESKDGRALLLVVHPAGEAWAAPRPDLAQSGTCAPQQAAVTEDPSDR